MTNNHIGQIYRVVQKIGTVFFVRPLTLPNINRFSKLFHCRNQEKIGNNIITKDPITPQVRLYTTLLNISVLKATINNKTTSVTVQEINNRKQRVYCLTYYLK